MKILSPEEIQSVGLIRNAVPVSYVKCCFSYYPARYCYQILTTDQR